MVLLRGEQKDLAETSKVSPPTIKRMETKIGQIHAGVATVELARLKAEVRGLDRAMMGVIARALEGARAGASHGRAILPQAPAEES